MTADSSLSDLLARSQAGDARAAELAFALLRPRVLAYCRRWLSRWPTAEPPEDIAHSALLRMFEDLPLYEPERSPLGWALGIAHYECRSAASRARRARPRQGSVEVAELPAAEAEDPASALSRAEEQAALAAVLAELEPSERALLGLPEGDAEALAELSAAALRKRRSRLLASLRQALADLLHPEARLP